MKETGETTKCDNCGTECSVFEALSAVLGTPLWFARCDCGCFYTSEDKIHWDLAWQIKPELVKGG